MAKVLSKAWTKPASSNTFAIEGKRELVEYVISGNRRSTDNVVNFCNFLRQSDSDVIQVSKRSYDSKDEELQSASKEIHFLIGNSPKIQAVIQNVLKNGGVVLTRTWAAAFDYIQDIDETQAKLLKNIYKSYFNSPIQLRDEIAEHNNVTWVRSFRFIFSLWESYLNGSFIDVLQALKLYIAVDVRKLTPKGIFQLRKLSDNVFSGISEQSYTCQIIENFNVEIKKLEFADIKESIFKTDFYVRLFDELDDANLIAAVNGLSWNTSYKLFTEVFSTKSKYMTVHQAKGLEWNKVIVSVTPNKFDKTRIINVYSDHQLINETPADEFTRMYYVACSRAREDLYIHLPLGINMKVVENAIASFEKRNSQIIRHEFVL